MAPVLHVGVEHQGGTQANLVVECLLHILATLVG